MTDQHTSRYYPATKRDHDLKQEEILNNEAYKNCKSDEGMNTNTHTHRYVPAQPNLKWTAAPVQSGHTSRYYPVTDKDIKLNRDEILKYDAYQNVKQDEGMNTDTHTSRYVPGKAVKSCQ